MISQQLSWPKLRQQEADKSLGLGLYVPQRVLKANSTPALPSQRPKCCAWNLSHGEDFDGGFDQSLQGIPWDP